MKKVHSASVIPQHENLEDEEDDSILSDDDSDNQDKEVPTNEEFKEYSVYRSFSDSYYNWRYYLLDLYESVTYERIKELMRWFLSSASIDISFNWEDLTMAMTLFVLFADNIKLMTAPKTVDSGFVIVNAICLFFFIFEFLGSSWSRSNIVQFYPKFVKEGYIFSFFWFLDLIAIFTMFFDIPFIADAIGLGGVSETNSSGGNANYSKAGRVVRLVRLVRLVKLYKVAAERRRRQKEEETLMELVRIGAVDYEEEKKKMALYDQRQSKLGSQLSESITRKVIIIVLIILCVLPILTFDPTDRSVRFATSYLHNFNCNPYIASGVKQVVLDGFLEDMRKGNYNDRFLVYLEMSPFVSGGPVLDYAGKIKSLRNSAIVDYDLQSYDATTGVTCRTFARYNVNPELRLNAEYSIILTFFIGMLLVLGSAILTSDAQRLVLDPIERMMNLVEAVANDPLAKLEFKQAGADDAGQYETRLLESTIEKITGLLRVGFGEAGAGIIKANLSIKSNTEAINPLLPGIRVYALVGFCDIHHFEDVNQRLGNDVLIFVNTIAAIVHENVHYWGGQCNKNLGNAFVIIWRIGDEETLLNQIGANRAAASSMASTKSIKEGRQTKVVDLRRVPGVDGLADRALIGYLKIIAEINRSKALLEYRNEPRLTNDGKVEFKVRMGFGMHAGWAIEGAVGSLQKVDATYLSPHVNMAARLETSSRQYGVPLLASQNFFDLCSNEVQEYCRRLDVVTVKGSEVPIGIYTYDCLQDQPFRDKPMRKRRLSVATVGSSEGFPPGSPSPGVRKSISSDPGSSSRQLSKRESNRTVIPMSSQLGGASEASIRDDDRLSPRLGGSDTLGLNSKNLAIATGAGEGNNNDNNDEDELIFMLPKDDTADVFEQDYDLETLRSHVTSSFFETFKLGVDTYLDGDWPTARKHLEAADAQMAAVESLGGDGPSKTLLSYMEERNWVAPESWKGFRPLTSK